jgi:hypothetical protein
MSTVRPNIGDAESFSVLCRQYSLTLTKLLIP